MAFDPVDVAGEGLLEEGFEAVADFEPAAAEGAEFGLGVFVFEGVGEGFEVVAEAGDFGGGIGFDGEGLMEAFLGCAGVEVSEALNLFEEGFGGLAGLVGE